MYNTLDTFEKKIVWLSKGWHNEKSNIEAITKLFHEEYGWRDTIYYSTMYRAILETLFKIALPQQLLYFYAHVFDNNRQRLATGDFTLSGDIISLQIMIKMLISEIADVQIETEDGSIIVDIELPEDDPMTEFIKNRRKLTDYEKCTITGG